MPNRFSVRTLIFILLALTSTAFASTPKIDSLRTLADTSQVDTMKALALDYLVWELMGTDANQAIEVAREQLETAEKSKNPLFISKAYFNLGTAHAQRGLLEESVPIFRKALVQAEKANSPKRRFQIYNNLGLVYKFLSRPDSAISCYKKSVESFLAMDQKEIGLADAYNNIAQLFLDQGQLDSAIYYLDNALSMHIELGVSNFSTADIYNNLGIVHEMRGNYAQALDHHIKSMKIYDSFKDTSNKYGYVLNNIGIIYDNQEEYDNALEYYTRSAEVIGKVGTDGAAYGRVTNNIGQIYIQKEDLDTALQILDEARNVQEVYSSESPDLIVTYSNIGTIYEVKGDLDEAINYYEKSLTIAEKVNSKNGLVEALNDLGRLENKIGNTKNGISFCSRSLELAKEEGLLESKMNACQCLYEAYEMSGNTAGAYTNYKLFREYRDSLINLENTKAITQKTMQYEFDKVQYQDSLTRAAETKRRELVQKEKDIRQEAEIQKQRAYTIAGGVGFALMLGLAFVLFRGYKNKQKANEIITEQKNAVEEQKEIIEEKNREIVDSISYAQRIQNAILPSDRHINKLLPNAFVFFSPKDIVSGDFYWVDQKGDDIFFAAVDCTGHGVPGAMVSVVGYNGLNRVLHEFDLTEPGQMLDKLSELVEKTFSKSASSIKDGMDLSLCKLNLKTRKLEYAGANNPLYIIRDKGRSLVDFKDHIVMDQEELKKTVVEIKADKQPIGYYEYREPFHTHKFQLEEGDSVYVFSDGYADQFGGTKGKKFMYKAFKQLLAQIAGSSIDIQKRRIRQSFMDWKGSLDQIDDVCVFGVTV